ncbi:MAG: helix-turn-helix domain-containing protein [Bdellovibrionales bacterium]
MTKNKSSAGSWIDNLRKLMEDRGYNPRSLSLRAGLNATAVRDMLEGRSKFPRYDTARSLAIALDTTPVALMGDEDGPGMPPKNVRLGDDLELLVEILTRLQEVAEEEKKELAPRELAAMAATIYRRVRDNEEPKKGLRAHVHELINYENLRRKRA